MLFSYRSDFLQTVNIWMAAKCLEKHNTWDTWAVRTVVAVNHPLPLNAAEGKRYRCSVCLIITEPLENFTAGKHKQVNKTNTHLCGLSSFYYCITSLNITLNALNIWSKVVILHFIILYTVLHNIIIYERQRFRFISFISPLNDSLYRYTMTEVVCLSFDEHSSNVFSTRCCQSPS